MDGDVHAVMDIAAVRRPADGVVVLGFEYAVDEGHREMVDGPAIGGGALAGVPVGGLVVNGSAL